MAFDQLKQQVEPFLGCQIGVELIVGLVGSIKARENLDDTLHDLSLPEDCRAHQDPGPSAAAIRTAWTNHSMVALEAARRETEYQSAPRVPGRKFAHAHFLSRAVDLEAWNGLPHLCKHTNRCFAWCQSLQATERSNGGLHRRAHVDSCRDVLGDSSQRTARAVPEALIDLRVAQRHHASGFPLKFGRYEHPRGRLLDFELQLLVKKAIPTQAVGDWIRGLFVEQVWATRWVSRCRNMLARGLAS
jgi:hypothetical protein